MKTIVPRRVFLKVMGVSGLLGVLSLFTGCERKCSMDSLGIIPRYAWQAVDPDIRGSVEGVYDASTNPGGWYVYAKPLAQALTTIVVHHSALPLHDGPLEIQEKHMHTKGFADIGYHFVIGVSGEIYAGRDLHVRGAHTGGHNTGTIGVVLLGNFEERTPFEAQLISLKVLSDCLRDVYALTHLAGHRDFQPGVTLCPGVHLEALLPELATELELEFGVGGYVGPPDS